MNHLVIICGVDTSKLPKLNGVQCQELLLQIKDGDKEARDKFILANLRLVLSVVQRFNNKGNSDDLFQIGTVGLIKALDNFDMGYGVKFSTYAVPMIIGEIRRYLKEQSGIRVTRSMRDMAYKALKTREILTGNNIAEPSVMEIAAELNVPIREVACALDAVSEPISLYDNVYNDSEDSMTVMEHLSDPSNTTEHNEELYVLNQALATLPDREKEIIDLRYYVGKTQVEISAELNISQAQVSRLEKNAIQHLKEQMY